MQVRIIGVHPLTTDEHGRLLCRGGAVFPGDDVSVVVCIPKLIHYLLRKVYVDELDATRQKAGQAPFTDNERAVEMEKAVDLIMEEDASGRAKHTIFVRADPDNMPLALAADEVLGELAPVEQVRFLNVRNRKIRDALKSRGQLWRIAPLAATHHEMEQMIESSRTAIACGEIYYLNKATGTRFLTCEGLMRLGSLAPDELRRQLIEIQEYSARYNRQGNPEVGFFLGGKRPKAPAGPGGGLLVKGKSFTADDFAGHDFRAMSVEQLQAAGGALCEKFRDCVPPELGCDAPTSSEWRRLMYRTLVLPQDEVMLGEEALGLGSVYDMQINWLPGAEIVDGELIVSPCCEEPSPARPGKGHRGDWRQKSRGLLFNFVREYGDMEYVNIGRVAGSLSLTRESQGRREVYIVEVKLRGQAEEIVKLLRKQRYDVDEHLDNGKTLLHAMREALDYTDYVLDRRLGCRQLGMKLTKILPHKIRETYNNKEREYHGISIWCTYFERDFVRGTATDKIPRSCYENDQYAIRFANLLGQTAAPNMIVGRCEYDEEKNMVTKIIFDDGDEVVQEDAAGLPERIVVVDQMGTFRNFKHPLVDFAAAYADSVNRRLGFVRCPAEFAHAYLNAFLERFTQIQQEYFRRKRAFDGLFAHQILDPGGSFRFRWEMVLKRLAETDAKTLYEAIRQYTKV